MTDQSGLAEVQRMTAENERAAQLLESRINSLTSELEQCRQKK